MQNAGADAAYTTYAASGYDKYESGSQEGRNIIGDKDTDYLGTNPANTTSVDKPGFRSNDEAKATYDHNGEGESKKYPHPVIQVLDAPIEILKIDQFGNALAGAKFNLYNENYDPAKNWDDAANRACKINTSDLVSTIETVTQGGAAVQKAVVSVSHMKHGTYYLVETKVPAGYIGVDSIKIVVTAQTTAAGSGTTDTITVNASIGSTPVGSDKLYKDGDQWVLKVMNSNGAELPHTGGHGTMLYYLMGLVLITAAGIGIAMKRKLGRY